MEAIEQACDHQEQKNCRAWLSMSCEHVYVSIACVHSYGKSSDCQRDWSYVLETHQKALDEIFDVHIVQYFLLVAVANRPGL
jgi:hypothetical protein